MISRLISKIKTAFTSTAPTEQKVAQPNTAEKAKARPHKINPKAKGIHDLRTRKAGTTSFIQFHLELDGKLNLFEAHEIADEVELLVTNEWADSEVIIHEDPHGLEEPKPQFIIDAANEKETKEPQ